ncbi:MAG: beta-glucosidase, partial [bacterium]|nr:beta-glucosidase [bacterium]
ADPWSVMTAYNKLDGTYCAEHPRLLQKILRDEWGFRGFVISDWFGAQSTAASANAGLDLEMPGPVRHYGAKLAEALKVGDVSTAALDALVLRMLEIHERAGLLDATIPDVEHANDLPEDRALARRAASEAIVLLRNESTLLPLDAGALSRVAVIGPSAGIAVMQGGGSARVTPHRTVTPLDGIRAALASACEIVHERGCANHRGTNPGLDTSFLERGEDLTTPELTTEIFAGTELQGEPVCREARRRAECVWVEGFSPDVDFSSFSARMRARFVAPESGDHRFSLKSFGRSRLLVDGECVLDHWTNSSEGGAFYGSGTTDIEAEVPMEAGRGYDLVVEYSCPGETGMVGFGVGCLVPDPEDAMERAVRAAAEADCAVVVVGLNADWETEGGDRVDMELPGRQAELIERIAAANPKTVVVVNTGSPISMEWEEQVPAILQLWYPGQEMGHALADVLFGATSPGGRLPTTFPLRYEDHPALDYYPGDKGCVLYAEGLMVGYRHYDTQGVTPRFAFGHGLSYSAFEYGEIVLEDARAVRDKPLRFEIEVRNSGNRRSSDVAQVYVHDLECRLPRPEQELRTFQKFELDPGEACTLGFELGPRAFSFYDPELGDWDLEPGEFEIRVGASSRDIRSRTRVVVASD